MAQEYSIPVLLDARGNPFSTLVPPRNMPGVQQAPPGAYLPNGQAYGPTLILVQPGGGRVRLTDRDASLRSMPYADIQASQSPIATVIGGMMRRLATLPRKVYQWPAGNRVVSMPGIGDAPPRTRPAFPEEIHDPDNALWSLLHRPAPGFGAIKLREWQALSLLTNGNSLLVKFRANGVDTPPTEVFPLDWRYAQAWARIGTPVLMWGTVQTGQWVSIWPSEVIHTMWTSVAGPQGAWLGTSPLAQLGVTIKIDEAAAAFAASAFNNASRPGGIVTLPPEVAEQQVDAYATRARNMIEDAYRGEDKAFRVAVLGGGAEWRAWQTGNDEAQLTQTRTFDQVEICGVYGQPFNAYFGQNPASAENDAQCWKALQPWAHLMDDTLQAQLVDCEPEWQAQRLFVKSDFDEVLYSDPLLLSDKMVSEVGAGVRSRDEARVRLGLPARGGAADELIYSGGAEGLVGELPGQFSAAVEEREMVMPPPGMEQPLDEVNVKLGAQEGGQ